MLSKEIGPYRILQKIAQGGMSSVYKGLHIDLEQEVAVKVLSAESFEDPYLRDRFINEAKIQAKLSHPNVIKTLNYIEQDGTIFLVMEYVNGETLDILLKKIGRLPVERALTISLSVLDAIEFMHSKGIIHRDIKPANIMISYDRFVKVMDFGIAKVMGEKGTTKVGIRIGTLWYMSPEQIRGEEASALTDIYSLGVTLYQMVTGRVPFTGDMEFDIMRGHLEENPTPPWKINRDIPKELGETILKAMAKNPKDRYQSIREFSEALKAASKAHEISQTKMIQVPDKLTDRIKWWRLPLGLRPKKRWAIIAVFVVILAVFASLAVLAQGKGKSTEPLSLTPNLPVQVVNPDLTQPEAGISVKSKSEQAVEEAPPLTKTQKANKQVQGKSPKKRHAPDAEKEMPSVSADDGWRIRK